MPSFETIIGSGRREVTVEYSVTNGKLDIDKEILVLASFEEGPEDISEYLSTYEINLLEWKCKQHFGEHTTCTS